MTMSSASSAASARPSDEGDADQQRDQALLAFSAQTGENVARLLSGIGASTAIIALAGLRMVIGAMAQMTRDDPDSARTLARFVGREMLSAVDELGLRDKGEPSDGA